MFRADDVLTPHFSMDMDALRQAISESFFADEEYYLQRLLKLLPNEQAHLRTTTEKASELVSKVRQTHGAGDGIDAFMQQYSLDTQEGIILMCLAEALLRIPDAGTADALIKDKLSGADWARHLKASDSALVNASTWGLMLTGKVIKLDADVEGNPTGTLEKMISRLGEPIVRKAMYASMKIMGKQFVLGRTIKEAMKTSDKDRRQGYTHSFDMLGESALTKADAARYFDAYAEAIRSVAQLAEKQPDLPKPTISIKLSALHPHYEAARAEQVLAELGDSLSQLVKLGREQGVGITIDAEEMDRLELSLDLFAKVYRGAAAGWGEFGLVVQAYSKPALPVLCWLAELAKQQGDEIPLRLVKGAYWDSEIKLCQQLGLENYPVFTRKAGTDASYLACARYLLSDATKGLIYPQFATHNAHTAVSIMQMVNGRNYEFQRLHGMGEELYSTVMNQDDKIRCRIYAPVGAHKDLLPYLVRRLLENGANTSFVHKLIDPKTPIEQLVGHPLEQLARQPTLANPRIQLPPRLFSDRRNSKGLNLNIAAQRQPFFAAQQKWQAQQWLGGPLINGKALLDGDKRRVTAPQNCDQQVGEVCWTTAEQASVAMQHALAAFPAWRDSKVDTRANMLDTLADLLDAHRDELIALCTLEGGKTAQDGIDEVREAVDFCRYYAEQARSRLAAVIPLPGPTGEANELILQGRGVFACISPWNFPLAIFVGQIAAALVAGNTVVAKPAEQTSLVAFRAVELMHQSGFPGDVVQLLPGDGATVGSVLTAHAQIAGVCFTGSTDTALVINRALAARSGAIAPLIAETGGQNSMLVDSTALPEQVVKDVVHSAFTSAGQRCSALRVLFLQEEIADRVIELLKGAMADLNVGDPALHSTDLGPVIDQEAQAQLLQHIEQITAAGKLIAQTELDPAICDRGFFVPPTAVEIEHINQLSKENFGPILHLIRYRRDQLDEVIAQINATGFGLTLGIHSRNESHALQLAKRINVGNVYINRNQIGAMVGVQPFGGQGLSGTGPKAGGPHYLLRFITEKTRTNNLTAIGGNATLLALGDG